MSSVDRGSESEYELYFLCVLGSSMRKQHPRIRRLLTTERGNRVISPLCQRAEEAIVCNSERHEEQSWTCTVENNTKPLTHSLWFFPQSTREAGFERVSQHSKIEAGQQQKSEPTGLLSRQQCF